MDGMISQGPACVIYVVYDSNCPMCSSFIRLVDAVYSKSRIKIVVSSNGYKLYDRGLVSSTTAMQIDSLRGDTIIAIHRDRLLTKMRAVSCIFVHSSNPFVKAVGRLIALVPSVVSDPTYSLVAKNRMLISRLVDSSCALRLRNISLVNDD